MKAYESNEISWWSHWAETKWLSPDAYILLSRDFDEYFFNRGGLLRITPDSGKLVERMEGEFEARGRKPHLLLQSDLLDSRFLTAMAQRGYRIADQMGVLEADDVSFKVNPDLKIGAVTESQLAAWATIYLDSFYGETRQMPVVLGILRKLLKVKEASLVMGTIKDKPAGIAALFRTGKVFGVYCVATHREWRGQRVATSMLAHSHQQATGEGGTLILQTILSDSTEGFYLKLGFKRAYVKDLFVKGRVRK
jgi:GNAT superfamily N-acetyltransferase